MVRVDIQMYYAELFRAYVNKEELEKQIKNVELENTIFVEITDINGKKVKFNPKYVAYIKFIDEKRRLKDERLFYCLLYYGDSLCRY